MMKQTMSDLDRAKTIVLNEYQRAAVEDESRACLVRANVGSGKTTVLVEKLRWLHEKKGVPYERMVVLTFTNKAADEIMARLVGERSGAAVPEGADAVVVSGAADDAAVPGGSNTIAVPDTSEETSTPFACFGTFHSVALYLLRECLPIERLGYAPGFAVIDPDEEVDLAAALIEEHGLQIKYKNRLKKRLEQEERAWRQGREQSRMKDDLFSLFSLLEREKVRLNKFSFSDLIRVATALLRETAAAAGPVAPDMMAETGGFQKPEWIVVDEVQDSDRQQLEFISALMGEQTHLFAVGDPNQVIYSWRGGAENIFYLLSHAFDARELTLPVNYRSNAAILDAARSFQQGGERLQGVRTGGAPVQVRNHYDPFSEAQYLAGRIAGLLAEGVSADEIAVFYRLQNQSQLLEKEFARRDIPYQVSLKRTASDLPVIRWLIRALRYACDPRDQGSGLAVLTDKNYGPGLTVKKARAVLEALERGADERPKGGKTELAGAAFLERLYGLRSQAFIADGAGLYAVLHLDEALNPATASYAQEKEWVLEFLQQAVEYCGKRQQAGDKDICTALNEFLNSSALYGLQIGKRADEKGSLRAEQPAVHLMTLHASKGLEFRYVFIIGVNYGLIPLSSREEGDEEEERRLFFVGMTRAKDHLELSYYTNPGMPRVVAGESRYLFMIPQHLLCREDRQEGGKTDLTAMRRAVLKLREERSSIADAGASSENSLPQGIPVMSGCAGVPEYVESQENVDTPEQSELLNVAGTAKAAAGASEDISLRVRHARYGVGLVLEETADKIKVSFEGFGEKEFLKAFVALERL